MVAEITRKMLLGELLINYPASYGVLQKRGFHCVGCGLTAYETIEDGARVHGLDDFEIEILVEEIKVAVKKQAEFEKAVKEVAPKKGTKLVIKPIDKPAKKTGAKKKGKDTQ